MPDRRGRPGARPAPGGPREGSSQQHTNMHKLRRTGQGEKNTSSARGIRQATGRTAWNAARLNPTARVASRGQGIAPSPAMLELGPHCPLQRTVCGSPNAPSWRRAARRRVSAWWACAARRSWEACYGLIGSGSPTSVGKRGGRRVENHPASLCHRANLSHTP